MDQSPSIIHDHRTLLRDIARRAMLSRGLLPDFSAAELAELDRIQSPAVAANDGSIRDLRDLIWASIDNDDSLDLDQLTVAQTLPGGIVKILVAVADVDALVKDGSAIDDHARQNTTSVYTAAEIFPMLPEKLSTGLTSLNLNEDRLATVIEMVLMRMDLCKLQTSIEGWSGTMQNWLTTASPHGSKGMEPNRMQLYL